MKGEEDREIKRVGWKPRKWMAAREEGVAWGIM
jgi:hypothetical protein